MSVDEGDERGREEYGYSKPKGMEGQRQKLEKRLMTDKKHLPILERLRKSRTSTSAVGVVIGLSAGGAALGARREARVECELQRHEMMLHGVHPMRSVGAPEAQRTRM
ncbi:hypothetical protein K438DRAFT_1755055 [Mycena galopus ATCC 62051]|nr:hypothetical protein K438DRAFT_1755055 [Mycena galopus ATCC 62051]